jgi:hypothetical protein
MAPNLTWIDMQELAAGATILRTNIIVNQSQTIEPFGGVYPYVCHQLFRTINLSHLISFLLWRLWNGGIIIIASVATVCIMSNR